MRYITVILLFTYFTVQGQYPVYTVAELNAALSGTRDIRISSYQNKLSGVSQALKGIRLDSLLLAIDLTLPRQKTDPFTATANQTSFTLTSSPYNNANNGEIVMYRNGLMLPKNSHSRVLNVVTYNPANNGNSTLAEGDRIDFVYTTLE